MFYWDGQMSVKQASDKLLVIVKRLEEFLEKKSSA